MSKRKGVRQSQRSKKKEEETLIDLVEARDSAQDFYERNQNKILLIAAIIALAIGAAVAYVMLIKQPNEQKAMDAMYYAELQFAQDSFARALESPGNGYDGFLDIIDAYSSTKAGNLAKYYAGISYLNLGRFDSAIEYLESFNSAGKVTPIMKNGALGDAYSELEDFDKALSYYQKAANGVDNELLAPYYLKKYALLSENQGNNENALDALERIRKDYPFSDEAAEAAKHLTRLEK